MNTHNKESRLLFIAITILYILSFFATGSIRYDYTEPSAPHDEDVRKTLTAYGAEDIELLKDPGDGMSRQMDQFHITYADLFALYIAEPGYRKALR